MKLELPDKTGKKLFKWIVENEKHLIAQKKFDIKKADPVSSYIEFLNNKVGANKASADQTISPDATKLRARLIINTTNLFDSHCDVHIPGIWNKSLAENPMLYLLQEHDMSFKGIISDNVTAQAKTMTWKSLGAPWDGSTQALVFDALIEKNRNEYMFGQYIKKYVKNHSVGMRYMKMVTCINDEDYPVQYENWQKYFPMVINADDCENNGFFWAILEAKVVEGSPVVRGSNFVTPVQSIEESKHEPGNSTRQTATPSVDTRKLAALNNVLKQFN